ncbi:LAMI_0C07404g1_1 [Lachancea mirantina]|uniref:GPI mannosyltransferase 2 n=1 Tax=Lachancea mirantina TaxID=1230905 RepID=A0A1G4J444_9SACH|nr:LAMI_0C07404g1_1 [Lachancea mirantina]
MAFRRITTVFFIVKVIQYGLIFFSPLRAFDTSTSLFIEQLGAKNDSLINKQFWNKLMAWDGVFYLKAMVTGKQEFEHEYAFSMEWPRFVRWLCRGNFELYNVLKIAVASELALNYISTLLLYGLTLQTFKKNTLRTHQLRALAEKSALIFVLSSATGFSTGPYSEPLSTVLTFLGILARELSIKTDALGRFECMWTRLPLYSIVSCVAFSLASINRSNCVLLGLYYIWDLLWLAKSGKYAKTLMFPLVSGFSMLGAYLYHRSYVPFQDFCPQRGEYCFSLGAKLPIPMINFYSFIQSRYWNNGFLKYWTLANIPNFLIALPNVVVLWYSTIYFSHQYPCRNLKPLIMITWAFLAGVIFFAHVQIVNRIGNFLPLHVWYLADRMNKSKKESVKVNGDDMLVKFYFLWLIFWVPLQTILFATFLPPA